MASSLDRTNGTENARDIRAEDFTRAASPDVLLTNLSARQRIAYLMCERSGLSDRAIAAHLHIGVGDARRLIEEARLALRRLLLGTAEGTQTR